MLAHLNGINQKFFRKNFWFSGALFILQYIFYYYKLWISSLFLKFGKNFSNFFIFQDFLIWERRIISVSRCSISGETYFCSVKTTFLCPRSIETLFGSAPFSISRVAKVCRYGIITTNRKSLYFQGVWAFVVFYSIPFPSWKLTKTIKKKGGCFINDKI